MEEAYSYVARERVGERVDCCQLTVNMDYAARRERPHVRPYDSERSLERRRLFIWHQNEKDWVRDAVDCRVNRVERREDV